MKIYDKEIRELLTNKFKEFECFISDPSTVILHELDICSGCARIDIAVVNGEIHGFEIKSEQDNLERLPDQMEYYNYVFDTITIVSTQKHKGKLKEMVPKWWGIFIVDYLEGEDSLTLKIEQKPRKNENVSVGFLVRNLWKNELLDLLSKKGLSKGVKRKTRLQLGQIVSERVNENDVKQFVSYRLKYRKGWKAVQLKHLHDG